MQYVGIKLGYVGNNTLLQSRPIQTASIKL